MSQIDVIRRCYGIQRVDKTLPVVDPVLQYAKSPTKKIGVLTIRLAPSAYVASIVSFQDSLTGQSIGSISVPAVRPDGADEYTLEFAPTGTLLSPGANLLIASTNGVAGRLHLESYQE